MCKATGLCLSKVTVLVEIFEDQSLCRQLSGTEAQTRRFFEYHLLLQPNPNFECHEA